MKYREASGNDDISEYPYNLSTFGYDATWLAALALTRSEDKIHHLASFGNNGTYAQKIYSNALEVQFEGASVSYVLELCWEICIFHQTRVRECHMNF